MAKFNLQIGDIIEARASATREEYTGKILFIPLMYTKTLTVIKVFYHGVRTKERGYIHNNCILRKINNI
jgi:hypothetical protein